MIDNNQHYMQFAIEMALKNLKSGGGPFGAVIVKDDVIIASSGNSVTVDNDPTAHAEINAIRKAAKVLNSFDLSGCTIYSSCEPCPMCLGAIYWARIDTLFFSATRVDAENAGFSDAMIYNEIGMPIHKRTLQTEHLVTENAELPFEEWKNLLNKTLY
ncbi:MAG TPA: nucleoside deaminase [Bacteroidales bacterium]|nr:nucleoside deaminase [Bacteroidales bacterium]HQP03057.1 nucleoside deaminase [Bacteroidales bacterium]